MLIAALFPIAKTWKQPQCPLIEASRSCRIFIPWHLFVYQQIGRNRYHSILLGEKTDAWNTQHRFSLLRERFFLLCRIGPFSVHAGMKTNHPLWSGVNWDFALRLSASAELSRSHQRRGQAGEVLSERWQRNPGESSRIPRGREKLIPRKMWHHLLRT